MKTIAVVCTLMLLGTSAFAVSPVNKTLLGDKAIRGYDPIAYFVDGKAVKGDKQFMFEWNGAKWFFSSAANLSTFMKDPEKYAPQYGGYCAWAVSQGKTADIDPDAWKIVNNKLYLNYDKDIQAKWEKDQMGNIEKADENWPKILTK